MCCGNFRETLESALMFFEEFKSLRCKSGEGVKEMLERIINANFSKELQ